MQPYLRCTQVCVSQLPSRAPRAALQWQNCSLLYGSCTNDPFGILRCSTERSNQYMLGLSVVFNTYSEEHAFLASFSARFLAASAQ